MKTSSTRLRVLFAFSTLIICSTIVVESTPLPQQDGLPVPNCSCSKESVGPGFANPNKSPKEMVLILDNKAIKQSSPIQTSSNPSKPIHELLIEPIKNNDGSKEAILIAESPVLASPDHHSPSAMVDERHHPVFVAIESPVKHKNHEHFDQNDGHRDYYGDNDDEDDDDDGDDDDDWNEGKHYDHRDSSSDRFNPSVYLKTKHA